jgi:hypothetical protein
MDYIRYADTIDNICISVLVTEMAIEFITVFIMNIIFTQEFCGHENKNVNTCNWTK